MAPAPLAPLAPLAPRPMAPFDAGQVGTPIISFVKSHSMSFYVFYTEFYMSATMYNYVQLEFFLFEPMISYD